MLPHAASAGAFLLAAAMLASLFPAQLHQLRSTASFIVLLGTCLGEYILLVITYRVTIHPLARYPGPLLAAITDWYTVYWIAEGSRHLELHRQHKIHGKYVRFGPNRLSINSPAASRDLHDVKGNTYKSDAYSSFKRFFGAEMSLTTIDHKAHAFRRRVNASALTTTAVRGLEGRISPHVDYLIQKIGQETPPASHGVPEQADSQWSPGQNMRDLLSYCIADIMGDVTFSQHFDTQRDEKNRHFVHDLPKGVAGIHLVGHMQSLFFCNLHRVIFKELIVGIGSLMALSRSFAHKRLEDKAEGSSRADIWQALLASTDPKTGRGFSDEELTSEASLFIIGGTDGMITSTTGTLFYLAHNPHALERLTRELREKFPAPAAGRAGCPIRFASPELQGIRYLFACIDESMRLSPPVPSILPRRVGPGGMTVDGVFFPGGIDLGIPHYSMHRNEEVFPDPLAYKPERWAGGTGSEARKADDDQAEAQRTGVGQAFGFTPFGAGRSACIGKYMAYQEVSYIIARLIWQFDIRMDARNPLGEGTGSGREGRERKDEFQLLCRFVSEQEGPMLQFKRRSDLAYFRRSVE